MCQYVSVCDCLAKIAIYIYRVIVYTCTKVHQAVSLPSCDMSICVGLRIITKLHLCMYEACLRSVRSVYGSRAVQDQVAGVWWVSFILLLLVKTLYRVILAYHTIQHVDS